VAHSRQKLKGRRNRGGGSFSALVHEWFESAQYAMLSARAVKATIDLYCQYRGSNNGDLTAAWSVMQKRGWTSKGQLRKALDELLARGWIIRTRQGGTIAPTLYALTFLGVDPCNGKLDAGIHADPKPSHLWKILGSTTLPKSKRQVRKKVVSRVEGHSVPHGGAQITELRRSVSRVEG
jgi:hypothetical protein